MNSKIKFVVNGTLMRNHELNTNLLESGATFVCETKTQKCYRLYSIDDKYPGMRKAKRGGADISVEVWQLDAKGLVSVLLHEPSGLSVGKIELHDASTELGVLAEEYICKGQKEITNFGGWREYMYSKGAMKQ